MQDGQDQLEETYLRRQIKDICLNSSQEIRSQSLVHFFNTLLVKFLKLLLESFEISPLIRVKEVHEIEQLSDVVIKGCLPEVNDWNLRFGQQQELTPVMMMR